MIQKENEYKRQKEEEKRQEKLKWIENELIDYKKQEERRKQKESDNQKIQEGRQIPSDFEKQNELSEHEKPSEIKLQEKEDELKLLVEQLKRNKVGTGLVEHDFDSIKVVQDFISKDYKI